MHGKTRCHRLDTHLGAHIVPMLRGVNSSLKRRSPGGRVNGCATVCRASERLPVNQERNRVLRVGNAVVRLSGRNASRSARNNARWDRATLLDPYVDVDMMRGEVVATGGC